jgi:uncharacterized protein (TIGR00725 family)
MTNPIVIARRACIAVVGDARLEVGHPRAALAEALGRGLVDAGFRVVTGGMAGAMQAAHRGVRSSAAWFDGAGIGILPGSDASQANEYVDIAIPTGLDHSRNAIVAQSAALVAVGGGAGTLSEMALAWSFGRLVIGMRCGGASELMADRRIDERVRYPGLPHDRVFGATTAEEAIYLLQLWLPQYVKVHLGILPAR